ncbi:MAG TPA: hypothetical protein DCY48_04740 [Candidatus Magasanikbacteria bacterium]|nr:hypothetical protein [Candidatus Magasanikbacteria bacterium]
MPHPPHVGLAASLGDPIVQRSAKSKIIHNAASRVFFKHFQSKERCNKISMNIRPCFINKIDAITIGIPCDAQVSALFYHASHNIAAIFFFNGVGWVIGKSSVWLKIKRNNLNGQARENLARHDTAHPVPRVHDNAERLESANINKTSGKMHKIIPYILFCGCPRHRFFFNNRIREGKTLQIFHAQTPANGGQDPSFIQP